MFRMGLAAAIDDMDGIELVGEAQRADQVPDLVAATSPDVVLLDVRLADGSGLEVNRWLAGHHPDVKVVMLTMSEDSDTALTALRDGASGYLVKGAGPQRVEHALRAAAAGDVVLDQSLALAVTELVAARRAPPSRPFPQLTEREFDILALVAEGLDNHAIARRLISARRRCATTCPTCSPRSTPPTGPMPSSSPAASASAPDPQARRRGHNGGDQAAAAPRNMASVAGQPAGMRSASRRQRSRSAEPDVGWPASRRIASVAGQPAGILSTMATSSTRCGVLGCAPRHRPSCRRP